MSGNYTSRPNGLALIGLIVATLVSAQAHGPSRSKRPKNNAKARRPDSGRFRNSLGNALFLPAIGLLAALIPIPKSTS